jgi:hypothetical protein
MPRRKLAEAVRKLSRLEKRMSGPGYYFDPTAHQATISRRW